MAETMADFLWSALGDQQDYYEKPDLPWDEDDPSIFRIRTKPGFIFDDNFWEVFQSFPGFLICHVAYYGPERREDAIPEATEGIFELRWTTWAARRREGDAP